MHLKQQIFLRVTGLLTLMIIGISVVFSLYSVQRHREMTKDLWITKAQTLADAVSHLVLWDDRVRLRQLLLSEQQGSDVLLYSFVVRDNKPYVYSFDRGVPPALLQRPPPGPGRDVWEYQTPDGMVVYDIATGIAQSGATLRLGLKRGAIDARMQPLAIYIAGISALAIGISIYLAFLLARRTTREVNELAKAISHYGELNEDGPTIKATTAEVSELVNSFKQLTSRRKAAEVELATLNAQLEQRVSTRTAQLQASNMELESFAYSVSHDLRTPLRGLEGFSHALLDEYGDKLDETGRSYIDRIRKGCLRMGKLIDDLLKLSRITRSEIRRSPLDLGEMAVEVIQELRRSDPGREVDVRIDAGLVASGDPTLLRSALENLLGNAWKFTRHAAQPLIQFSATSNDGNRIFFVRDNGAGFDMEYVDKLFGAFQRLHRLDEFEGSGIGLASVQRVVLMHGGRIWAEGKENSGATFYFTLGEQ